MRAWAWIFTVLLTSAAGRAQAPEPGAPQPQGPDESLVGPPEREAPAAASPCEEEPTAEQEAVARQVGLVAEPVTPRLSQALGSLVRSGAVVAEVKKGGAAARAGLQRGDVVIALEDEPVSCPQVLLERLSVLSGLSSAATVEYVREGVTGTARLALPAAKPAVKPTRAQAH